MAFLFKGIHTSLVLRLGAPAPGHIYQDILEAAPGQTAPNQAVPLISQVHPVLLLVTCSSIMKGKESEEMIY